MNGHERGDGEVALQDGPYLAELYSGKLYSEVEQMINVPLPSLLLPQTVL